MATKIYTDEGLEIQADFDLAACSLAWRETGETSFRGSPYQVADARHDPDLAFEIIRDWLDNAA